MQSHEESCRVMQSHTHTQVFVLDVLTVGPGSALYFLLKRHEKGKAIAFVEYDQPTMWSYYPELMNIYQLTHHS